MHLAWAIIGFVRIYLVFESWAQEARLRQDLVAGVVYLGTALSILAFVFGVPIGTLVATSGVVASFRCRGGVTPGHGRLTPASLN